MNIPEQVLEKIENQFDNEKIEITAVGQQLSSRSFKLLSLIMSFSLIMVLGILAFIFANGDSSLSIEIENLMNGRISNNTILLLAIPGIVIADVITLVILGKIFKRPEYYVITNAGVYRSKNNITKKYPWSQFKGELKEYSNAIKGTLIYSLNTFRTNSKGQKINDALSFNDIHSYRTIKDIISRKIS